MTFTVQEFGFPIQDVIYGARKVRLETPEGPVWVVASGPMKEGMLSIGYPTASVWTVGELMALPWPSVPTLASVLHALTGSRERETAQPAGETR